MTTFSKSTLFVSIPLLLTATIASARLTATTVCPTSSDLRAKVASCEHGTEDYRDENSCPNVRCRVPLERCPSLEDLDKERKRCQDQGAAAQLVSDGICQIISCANERPSETITCEKVITMEGCTRITCKDSYVFDSCKSIECKNKMEDLCGSYTDAYGCEVKTCGDKKERTCPKTTIEKVQPVEGECTIIKREGSCYFEQCANGLTQRKCPIVKPTIKQNIRTKKPTRRELSDQKFVPPADRGMRLKSSSSSSSSSSVN